MRILLVGDVVGEPGRRVLKKGLRHLRNELRPDVVVVNGENAAAGNGMTPATVDEMFRCGADVITSGNHTWDRREILEVLDHHEHLLRPANYPHPAPGRGATVFESEQGFRLGVINMMGRLFMVDVDDPFRMADAILEDLDGVCDGIVVDFHAEATSEKQAFGRYLDGRVGAVVGTHTHVPTADARILRGGTAYMTDLGMTGPYDSIIGVDGDAALKRFLTQRPVRFSPAQHDVRLSGALVELIPETGLARSIERIEFKSPE